jgi:hypothetical protein
MPQATRIEFCANDECVATFEANGWDRTLTEHYYLFGVTFYVFKGRKMLKLVGREFNYERQLPIPTDNVDRFDISTYDFCEMLQAVIRSPQEWKRDSINSDLHWWIQHSKTLDTFLLNFIVSPIGFRRIY